MKIIFCSDPLYPERIDMSYTDEANAAQAAGLDYEIINFERLTRDSDAAAAVRRVKHRDTDELAIYRGWMLRPEAYAQLFEGLADRGVKLINSPEDYKHCHYLPESYSQIAGYTPNSVWLPLPACLDMDNIMSSLTTFGDRPVILKDYVKSPKHEWAEACFTPSATNRDALTAVVERFLDLQGEELNAGLVFREFAELKSIGTHSRSGMPLTREYRLFFLNGKIMHLAQYWGEGDYEGDSPPDELFTEIAQTIASRFFTMDVAQRTDGTWTIVELGDGQVAGLPDTVGPDTFYSALADAMG